MVAISKELPEREPPSIQAVGAVSCESPSQIISKASRASPIVKALRPMCHPWGAGGHRSMPFAQYCVALEMNLINIAHSRHLAHIAERHRIAGWMLHSSRLLEIDQQSK
jgi:hypothetical protein